MALSTIAALLGASAISSAASIYNNLQNIKYAKETNDESVDLANTAHQREVRDLMAAGLNPILTASGNGASTPTLKTPNLESIDGGIGNSGRSIARALNGSVDAEVDRLQSEASSARAFAQVAEQDAQVRNFKFDGDLCAVNTEMIENAARNQALTGVQESELDDWIHGKEGWKTYYDLVQQYRNEIESGRYSSSVERAVLSDIVSGVSSAAQIFSNVRPRPGKVGRQVNNYNMIGGVQ